ncbi:alpha/beta hydrolase family protein [Mesoterricola silvestris]|uniref:AB hydrolase-1 domain-containing protein n=1 Tax=Mesoterricola silvestris TaxID=2927979 RepID=A0AA48GPX7_9BACT|nr:alpha/beta fold hydrolase [Mesoterricola silvestris]BDU71837.1 hypothetical protein METEAL_10110 [Mesoterricola silvestris]
MRIGLLLSLPAVLAAAQPAVREMSLVTPDGFTVKGTLTVPAQAGRRPVVILAHQFGYDRTGWKPLAEDLNARGIATLALDLRGHGQSTRKGDATVAVTTDFAASSAAVRFDLIPGDLAQAAQWVRKQPRIDGRRVGLAGASIGAYSALVAAPGVRPVAVLALSPGGGWGEKPEARMVRAVEQAKASVFVAAAEGDPIALANAQALKGVFGVYARIRPGKEHGFAYLPELTETLGGWFGEVLGRHPVAVPSKAAPLQVPAEDPKAQPQ